MLGIGTKIIETDRLLLRKIELNVILIACQRKSLDNLSGGKNSISNSVENIYDFLKIGFKFIINYPT